MADVFSSLPLSIDVLVSAEELDAVRGLLGRERGSWITADLLQERLGWRRQRTAERVRKAIKELQLIGVPIVESHAGFSYATCVSMVDRCLEKERMRLQGLQRTIGALERIRASMVQSTLVVY